MKIDGPLYATVENAASEAKRLQEIGYDGVYTFEGNSDPFFPLLIASEHASSLDISTGIAVAFPRNPSHLAYQAWDLQKFSKGKFMLGLGPQVRAHNEKRFSVEFDKPAARMREHILATKAFFDCWQDGEKLDFRGEFRSHTLMTPMFNAGPQPYGKPPILLGALGPKMTEVAGEVADGILIHPFNNMTFIKNHTLPSLQKGFGKAGKSQDDFIVSIQAIIITGANEDEYKAADTAVRSLLGFYGSTPAYKPPMDAIGMGDLQPKLNTMTKEGKWDQLNELINDEFVSHFAICGEPKEIAQKLVDQYGELATRISIYAPYESGPDVWPSILADIKRLTGRQ